MLTKRSTEKEIMDLGPNETNYHEYIDCLKKLFRVSKLFGFFRQTVKALKNLPQTSSLVEIGCGGGLFLLHLSQIFPDIQMTGKDIAPEAITQAQLSLQEWQKKIPNINVTFELEKQAQSDIKNNTVDVVLTTLVCHHMDDLALIDFLQSSYKRARKAVIINDLHRHILAEFFYSLISPLLFQNRMITHDGLVSIRRAFKYKEIKLLLEKANIKKYQIKWCFPFRWQIILEII